MPPLSLLLLEPPFPHSIDASSPSGSLAFLILMRFRSDPCLEESEGLPS